MESYLSSEILEVTGPIVFAKKTVLLGKLNYATEMKYIISFIKQIMNSILNLIDYIYIKSWKPQDFLNFCSP